MMDINLECGKIINVLKTKAGESDDNLTGHKNSLCHVKGLSYKITKSTMYMYYDTFVSVCQVFTSSTSQKTFLLSSLSKYAFEREFLNPLEEYQN